MNKKIKLIKTKNFSNEFGEEYFLVLKNKQFVFEEKKSIVFSNLDAWNFDTIKSLCELIKQTNSFFTLEYKKWNANILFIHQSLVLIYDYVSNDFNEKKCFEIISRPFYEFINEVKKESDEFKSKIISFLFIKGNNVEMKKLNEMINKGLMDEEEIISFLYLKYHESKN